MVWLWPGRIPLGKLSLLAGEPGVGKSTILLDGAARVTRGLQWPDGGMAPRGRAIILTAEDDLSDTVRPRLDGLGADVARIAALTMVRTPDGEQAFSLEKHLPALERAIGPETKLVIIDPVLAYTGRADTHVSAEVRALLAPLAALAGRTRVAVVGIIHLNKRQGGAPLHRVLGAIDFVAAARSVLLAAEDPDDPSRLHLAVVKCNLAAPARTLAYRFADGRLTWDGPSSRTATQLLAVPVGEEERQALADAGAFLLQLLGPAPIKAGDVLNEAREAGISERTLRRAKQALRVQSRHRGEQGHQGGGEWVWELPETDAE